MKLNALRIVVASLLFPIAVANAALISIVSDTADSTESLATFTGTLEYTALDANSGELEVFITNTTASGFLTAFAMNNPGNVIVGVTVATATNLDEVLGLPDFQNDVSVSPFGDADFGTSLNSDWLGGGSPNGGVGAGQTGSWIFTLAGTGMDTLTTADFVAATHTDGEFFLARFRGITTGAGSDKVPALTVVPEASSFVMMGMASLGLAFVRRRRTMR